jgi:hypothetical protein
MKFAMPATVAAAALGILLALPRPAAVGADEQISFPADYAQTFENYLSLDRTQDPDQVIRLFANATALEAAKAGQPLPEGSTIVAEVYKAKLDKDGKVIVSALDRRIRDKLALIAVMQKRGEGFGKDLPAELQNNGWDFAAFKPDGTHADKDLNKCRACHAPLKDTQHLFSIEHMR